MSYRNSQKSIRILFFLLIIFTLLSCSKIDEDEWTILVYMAADNGLNLDALTELDDIMNAEFSDNINIIVQVDYAASNSSPAAYRYHIYPGLKEQISYLGEIDSGDENELTAFANWGFNNYPSEKQALIIWSHGNGWYPFFCPDVEADNDINIADGEFRRGIKNINEYLEILILDACNM